MRLIPDLASGWWHRSRGSPTVQATGVLQRIHLDSGNLGGIPFNFSQGWQARGWPACTCLATWGGWPGWRYTKGWSQELSNSSPSPRGSGSCLRAQCGSSPSWRKINLKVALLTILYVWDWPRGLGIVSQGEIPLPWASKGCNSHPNRKLIYPSSPRDGRVVG